MTKKDYELIASTILGAVYTGYDLSNPDTVLADGMDYWTLESIANDLSEALQRENPKFKRDKFLEACGIGGSL